jgi:hypothetical protein
LFKWNLSFLSVWFPAGLANHRVSLIQVFAVFAGPHSFRFLPTHAEKETRAKRDDADPSPRRDNNDQRPIRIPRPPQKPKHDAAQKLDHQVARDRKGSPKPRVSTAPPRISGDSAGGYEQ